MRIAALLLSLVCCVSAATAGAAGKWNLSATGPDGDAIKAQLTLEQNAGAWSGSVQGPDGVIPLRNVAFKADTLTCVLTYQDTDVTLTMKLDGDRLRGRYEAEGGPTGPVEANRVPLPASAAGVWKLTTTGPDGDSIEVVVTLKQDAAAWSGRIQADSYGIDTPLSALKINAGAVAFEVETEAGTYAVTASVQGDKFSGTAVAPNGSRNPVTGSR